MKKNNTRLSTSVMRTMILVIVTIIVSGCASTKPGAITPMQPGDNYRHRTTVLPFQPINIQQKKKNNQYQQKTASIIILIDDSSDKKNLISKTLENLMATMPKNLSYHQEIIYKDELSILSNKAISKHNFLSSALEYYTKQLENSEIHSTIITSPTIIMLMVRSSPMVIAALVPKICFSNRLFRFSFTSEKVRPDTRIGPMSGTSI